MIVALQGLLGVVVGAITLARAVGGVEDSVTSGYALGLLYLALGGPLLAAGVTLVLGKRWGRGPSIITQLLLLPVAWTLLTGSNQPLLGTVVAVAALAVLVLLIFPPATRSWFDPELA